MKFKISVEHNTSTHRHTLNVLFYPYNDDDFRTSSLLYENEEQLVFLIEHMVNDGLALHEKILQGVLSDLVKNNEPKLKEFKEFINEV